MEPLLEPSGEPFKGTRKKRNPDKKGSLVHGALQGDSSEPGIVIQCLAYGCEVLGLRVQV